MVRKNAHCSYCGERFAEKQPWPRTCGRCGRISYLNPSPVVVLVLPVDDGVLCIRRDIEPGRGKIALPGGFLDMHETWQQGAARELREETHVVIDPDEIRVFQVLTPEPHDGHILIFGVGRPRASDSLPPFLPTNETSERLVVREPMELVFPLHTRVLREYLASKPSWQG
jgi:ADP-ribose pyrophosphatase YjhB (NUDIX family)